MDMALLKLVWNNYSRKLLVSIKYENIHSFKEGGILLYQSILETRISHLPGSAHFTIPLKVSRDIFDRMPPSIFPVIVNRLCTLFLR